MKKSDVLMMFSVLYIFRTDICAEITIALKMGPNQTRSKDKNNLTNKISVIIILSFIMRITKLGRTPHCISYTGMCRPSKG